MTHAHWQRFLAAGEELATEQPAFFPSVVALIEAVAEDNAVRKIVHEAFGITPGVRPGIPSTPSSSWKPTQIADALCLIEPQLTDLGDKLDNAIAGMSRAQRTLTALWARNRYRDEQHDDECEPLAMPRCVALLFAMLSTELEL